MHAWHMARSLATPHLNENVLAHHINMIFFLLHQFLIIIVFGYYIFCISHIRYKHKLFIAHTHTFTPDSRCVLFFFRHSLFLSVYIYHYSYSIFALEYYKLCVASNAQQRIAKIGNTRMANNAKQTRKNILITY